MFSIKYSDADQCAMKRTQERVIDLMLYLMLCIYLLFNLLYLLFNTMLVLNNQYIVQRYRNSTICLNAANRLNMSN